jgi:hypothetical protein
MQSADKFTVHRHDVVYVVQHAGQCRHSPSHAVDPAHLVYVGPARCSLSHHPLTPRGFFQFHFDRLAKIMPTRCRHRLDTDPTSPPRIGGTADPRSLPHLVVLIGELALARTVDTPVGMTAMLKDLAAALLADQRDFWPTHGSRAELIAALCRAGLNMGVARRAAERPAADDAGPGHCPFVAVVQTALTAVQAATGIHLVLHHRKGGTTGFTNTLDLLASVRYAQFVSARGRTSLPLLSVAMHEKRPAADDASLLDSIAAHPRGGDQLAATDGTATSDDGQLCRKILPADFAFLYRHDNLPNMRIVDQFSHGRRYSPLSPPQLMKGIADASGLMTSWTQPDIPYSVI